MPSQFAKRHLALALVVLLAAPPYAPATSSATLTGKVTSTAGVPLGGLDLEFVNLDSGQVSAAQTDGGGIFRASFEPGLYKVDAPRGYTIVRGPQVVKLVAGEPTLADLVLSAQETPASPTGAEHGKHLGDFVAVSLFSGALLWVVLRVTTNRPEQPSPSR